MKNVPACDCLSVKDHCLVPLQEDPVPGMVIHRPGEYDAFEVAAALDQVPNAVTVRDTDDILLNNRALVRFLGHIVAGGTDNFYAPFIGLPVGTPTLRGMKPEIMETGRKADRVLFQGNAASRLNTGSFVEDKIVVSCFSGPSAYFRFRPSTSRPLLLKAFAITVVFRSLSNIRYRVRTLCFPPSGLFSTE